MFSGLESGKAAANEVADDALAVADSLCARPLPKASPVRLNPPLLKAEDLLGRVLLGRVGAMLTAPSAVLVCGCGLNVPSPIL